MPLSCSDKALRRGMEDSLLPGLPDHLALYCLARVSSLAPLWRVCKLWQNMVDSEEFLRVRALVGERGVDWLYTLVHNVEGSYGWHAFDPIASKWHSLAPMPEDVDFQLTSPGSIGLLHSVQCVSTSNKLVMVAGLKQTQGNGVSRQWSQLQPALEHPWVFDTRKSQWKKGHRFGTPRKWCVCGVVDDKVYVASGCGHQWDMSVSKSTDMYDPEMDAWESLPSLESSKFSGEAISAVNVQGKLHMMSGRGVFIKEGAVFCSATRKWSKMPISLKRGWTGACVAVNGYFYALDQSAGKLNIYDTKEDRWKLFMEDSRLNCLSSNVTATKGKICTLVEPAERQAEIEGSLLRIIDVVSTPPCIFDLPVPQGRVVSMQVLSRIRAQ